MGKETNHEDQSVVSVLIRRGKKQVLYITVGATVESSVPLHYIHLSFCDDWFDNEKESSLHIYTQVMFDGRVRDQL